MWLGRRLRSTRGARYQLHAELACGGMANVWLACLADDPEQQFAIKVIREELAHDPRIVELFAHEALIATRLKHRGIVEHRDFGVDAGLWFLVTEYLRGATLRDVHERLLDRDQGTPLWFVVGVLARVCATLDHMHGLVDDGGHGLLHNALSPENIMITTSGAVKLLDLGSVAPSGVPGSARPHVGKYTYLPPELVLGRELDRRSDVYSLGVMLYELAVGEKPFRGDQAAVVAAIAHGPPPDPCKRNPEVPPAVARVIRKAMARDPGDRYPSAGLLARELRMLVHHYLAADDEELGDYVSALFPERTLRPSAPSIYQADAQA